MTEFGHTLLFELNENGTGHFIDPNTGFPLLIADARKHVVLSKEKLEAQRKYRERQAARLRLKGKNFVVCPHESVKELSQKLKLHELGALIKLLPYLQLNHDGLLVQDGENMKIKDIGRVIGKKRGATTTILKRLAGEGVIIKGGSKKTPSYSISRSYHWMGSVEPTLRWTKLYQVENRSRLDTLSIQEAGMLYKLLPYFHYETYWLCANPNDKELKRLNHKQLAELIGEDERVVNEYLRKLDKLGFVMKLQSHGAVNYLVNPDIMFRQDYETEYTEFVRRLFQGLEHSSKLVV